MEEGEREEGGGGGRKEEGRREEGGEESGGREDERRWRIASVVGNKHCITSYFRRDTYNTKYCLIKPQHHINSAGELDVNQCRYDNSNFFSKLLGITLSCVHRHNDTMQNVPYC